MESLGPDTCIRDQSFLWPFVENIHTFLLTSEPEDDMPEECLNSCPYGQIVVLEQQMREHDGTT